LSPDYNPRVATAVEKLEAAFAESLGVQGAVATGYGRGALWLALQLVIGDRPGAEVLVPDFICAQVPEAVRRAGGRASFFPVQRDLTVREQDLEAAITRDTRAVVLAHYYGRGLTNIGRLAALCRRRSIVVIEDCALALGARVQGRLVGRFGDLAVFSFTKSDWCYGGGVLTTPVRDWASRLRQLRAEKCRPAPRLAFCYGLLRRADFAANSPGRSRIAGWAGRWLERGLSLLEPTLRGNFFDAGRFDAAMPELAARRALHILMHLDATIARRHAVQASRAAELLDRVCAIRPGGLAELRLDPDLGETGAFLLLQANDGPPEGWLDLADHVGHALRLSWPAYQRAEPAETSPELKWLRDHLLIAEMT